MTIRVHHGYIAKIWAILRDELGLPAEQAVQAVVDTNNFNPLSDYELDPAQLWLYSREMTVLNSCCSKDNPCPTIFDKSRFVNSLQKVFTESANQGGASSIDTDAEIDFLRTSLNQWVKNLNQQEKFEVHKTMPQVGEMWSLTSAEVEQLKPSTPEKPLYLVKKTPHSKTPTTVTVYTYLPLDEIDMVTIERRANALAYLKAVQGSEDIEHVESITKSTVIGDYQIRLGGIFQADWQILGAKEGIVARVHLKDDQSDPLAITIFDVSASLIPVKEKDGKGGIMARFDADIDIDWIPDRTTTKKMEEQVNHLLLQLIPKIIIAVQ